MFVPCHEWSQTCNRDSIDVFSSVWFILGILSQVTNTVGQTRQEFGVSCWNILPGEIDLLLVSCGSMAVPGQFWSQVGLCSHGWPWRSHQLWLCATRQWVNGDCIFISISVHCNLALNWLDDFHILTLSCIIYITSNKNNSHSFSWGPN